MDIFNRPPAISEDTVQYRLYPAHQPTDKVSVLALATVVKSHADSLLPGFLWHRDPFELKVASDANGWNLEGTVRVGDCIDDEWCVVWLLREISKKWDVTIKSVSLHPPYPSRLNYYVTACRTRTENFFSSKRLRSCRPGWYPLTPKTECAPIPDKIMPLRECFNTSFP